MKTNSLRACLSLFRMSMAESIQYRSAAFANAIMSMFYALIDITVFSVFYRYADNRDAAIALSLPQMVSYLWLKQVLLNPTGIYSEFLTKIKNGDVGLELCRPWDLYMHWFSKLAAWRVGAFWWNSVIIFVIALLMPASYRLGPPVSAANFVLFILSAASAFFLWASFHMLVTTIRLGITWGEGPTYMMFLVSNILSGMYLPLQLWPDFMQGFLMFQPFAGSFDLPVRLYVGSMALNQAAQTILLQLGWSLLFILAGRLLMRHKLQNLIVQGG